MFSRITERLEVDMESLLSTRQFQQVPDHDEDDPESTDEPMSCPSQCPSVCSDILPTNLSLQERLGGCIACMILGYVLSFGSFFRFHALLRGDPLPFVTFSTIGNVISLGGSCFLSGPRTQMGRMFHPTRKVATTMYLGSLGLTLVVAFFGHGWRGQAGLLLVLMVCQYVSVGWYCLTYIPFARQMVTRLCTRYCGGGCGCLDYDDFD